MEPTTRVVRAAWKIWVWPRPLCEWFVWPLQSILSKGGIKLTCKLTTRIIFGHRWDRRSPTFYGLAVGLGESASSVALQSILGRGHRSFLTPRIFVEEKEKEDERFFISGSGSS